MMSKYYFISLRLISGPLYVTGIVANCISLSYFIRRQHKGLGNRLLLLLNVLDLLVCVTSVTTMIPLQIYLSTKDKIAWIVYFIGLHFYRPLFECTGYTTCLVSVTRTIKVCRPLYSIRGFWTGITFMLFVLCICTREVIFWYQDKTKPLEDPYKVLKYQVAIVASGITICIIVVVISSMIAAYWLLRKNKKDIRVRKSERNRYATVTILILSVTFCLVNATFISAGVMAFCIIINVFEDSTYLRTYREIVFTLAQCLNSAINPIIYLTRKKDMRNFLLETCRKVKDRCSKSRAEPDLELRMRDSDVNPIN